MEYISTTDVLTNVRAGTITENAPLEEQEHFKSDGYASTKYVAEEICLLAQKRGLDVNIYRLGLITGDTVTGKNDSSQWFQQLLEASMRLKALFSTKGFEIPITPVDFVTASIVALAYAKERNKIYHLTNDSKTELVTLLEMYNDGEEKLDYVSLYEFIQRLKQYNVTHDPLAVTTFFEKYLEADNEILEALQSQEREVKEIETSRTVKDLKAENIVFPTIDKTLVKKYFDASVE